MNKIVNFNDNKNKIDFVVGGATFTIARITHNIIAAYGDYMTESGKFLNETAAEEDENKLKELIAKYSKYKVFAIYAITEQILLKNGYTYDQQYWLDNTTLEDMENFVVACLTKDNKEDKKKDPVKATV